MSVTQAPLLVGRGLSKVYGKATALAGVDFTLRAGEVRALIGSNGAGKSTLVKVLTGATTPSSGSVTLAGEPVPLGDPQQVIRRGIACRAYIKVGGKLLAHPRDHRFAKAPHHDPHRNHHRNRRRKRAYQHRRPPQRGSQASRSSTPPNRASSNANRHFSH